jgi:hypothetical protein
MMRLETPILDDTEIPRHWKAARYEEFNQRKMSERLVQDRLRRDWARKGTLRRDINATTPLFLHEEIHNGEAFSP